MSLPDPSPKLPRWIFFLTDAALVTVAILIATHSGRPLSAAAVFSITACVLAGAIVGLVPLVAYYEREKNEALDERQNALEALSRTVATSAEQISIAAAGLHEIAELAQKNLKHAEQLPHKLQEKIAEFQAQLDNRGEDEREELEKEIAELRSSESDRLDAVAEKIRRTVVEIGQLEAAAQTHLAEARQALADVPGRATASVDAAATAAIQRVVSAQSTAAAEIDSRLAARTAAALTAIEAALSKPVVVQAAATPVTAAEPSLSDDASAVSRRIRKARREGPPAPTEPEPPVAPEAVVAAIEPVVAAPTSPEAPPAPAADLSPASTPPSDPGTVPVGSVTHLDPVAPRSSPPFADNAEGATTDSGEAAATPAPATASPVSDADIPAPTAPTAEAAMEAGDTSAKPVRKRAPKRSAVESAELSLGLAADDFAQVAPEEGPVSVAEVVERVISSDGATRLLVTAYIGIGNRLFIRGDGPGLNWEKGVPLQFVSIGKWRWETADASAPIRFKLYKNDEIECTGLGPQTLEPGHQEEVSAKF